MANTDARDGAGQNHTSWGKVQSASRQLVSEAARSKELRPPHTKSVLTAACHVVPGSAKPGSVDLLVGQQVGYLGGPLIPRTHPAITTDAPLPFSVHTNSKPTSDTTTNVPS